jgi:hypothetical protein
MTRLSTIALDVALRDRPPPQWTPDWVRLRLVEAFRIERRLPSMARYGVRSSWPSITPEFSDVVARGELASERVLEVWANAKSPVYAAEIERMEQAFAWLPQCLLRHEAERLCLVQWAKAKAFGFPVARLLARRRWSKGTFYKHVSTGSFIIAAKLHSERVEVT